jgi:hypothetical protein
MKYVIGMVSSSMMYIPSFVKFGLDVQKLFGGIHTESKVISYVYSG